MVEGVLVVGRYERSKSPLKTPCCDGLLRNTLFHGLLGFYSVASPGFTRTNQPGVRDGSRGRDGTPTFDANRVAQKNGDWGSDVAGVEPNNDSIGSASNLENIIPQNLDLPRWS